ncbi:CoA transferase [Yimella sp. cx-573]|nr:CoA transferase [Yimella sp. cx-573]
MDDVQLPLAGVRVVSIATNLPGPAAAHRLQLLGAQVTKVEPPAGDLLAAAAPAYYTKLSQGQEVIVVDLKTAAGREQLDALLQDAELFITSNRPTALAKLGLDWSSVSARHPGLSQVAIVGHPGVAADVPGHDLTYQAHAGTLQPPLLPTVLVADLAGAERAAAEAVTALHIATRTGVGSYREVALSDVATDLAQPAKHGMTTPGGFIGGVLPQYGIYAAAEGWVALAALEPHFWAAFLEASGVDGSRESLEAFFACRTARDWEHWAHERGLPLAAVRAP